MKSFEPVYKELEYLFIEKLPEYIEKINIEHNDNIILKPFLNTKLNEDCFRQPCFMFGIAETEYSEKDRIIENTVFNVYFEIKVSINEKNKISVLWRYIEAINMMLKECDTLESLSIKEIKQNQIYLKITL